MLMGSTQDTGRRGRCSDSEVNRRRCLVRPAATTPAPAAHAAAPHHLTAGTAHRSAPAAISVGVAVATVAAVSVGIGVAPAHAAAVPALPAHGILRGYPLDVDSVLSNCGLALNKKDGIRQLKNESLNFYFCTID